MHWEQVVGSNFSIDFAVASSRRMFGGATLLNVGSHANAVGRIFPETVLIVLFNSTSIFFELIDLSQTGAQYSAAE